MTLKTLGMAAVVAVAVTGFVFGSSPAKAQFCPLDWKPVCANDHGFTHTFSNTCSAKMWGAKVLYNGECGSKPKAVKKPAKKMAKPAAEKKEMKK